MATVLAGFVTLTGHAVYTLGLLGMFSIRWGTIQVFANLVIVCALAGVWIFFDARQRRTNPWPYILLTALTGCIGPLLYLLRRARDGPAERLVTVVVWNLSLAAVGAVAVATIGEGYLRASKPFMQRTRPQINEPGVGALWQPGSVVHHTNGLDFWTTSPINRWGFADREPLPTSRAETSCHVAVFGDSFVEAVSVPIAARMHVQFERLAASELPHLDITTSAFARGGAGQVAQLPYYDNYATRLKPKLVVLVFIRNDFDDNERFRRNHLSLERMADGTFRLRPPDPRWQPVPYPPARRSYLAEWLKAKRIALQTEPPKSLREASLCLDCTSFALRQFESRARRDNASLVILSEYRIEGELAEWLNRLADGLPVISLADYLATRKLTKRDVRWDHDLHWNPSGHRVAAEALLEYLRANEAICSRAAT